MLKNRICYGLVLLFSALFYICFNGYLSLYVFALALSLPLLSLILALPGLLGTQLKLSLGTKEATKGGSVPLQILVTNPLPIPSGRVKARLLVENTLTGTRQEEKLAFSPSRRTQILNHNLSTPTCGIVRCRLFRIRLCDPLGLFALPLEKPVSGSACFYPAVYPAAVSLEQNLAPDPHGELYSGDKPGDDPTELFGLRAYAPGDKLSRIHWKLSEKTDQLVVKEFSLPLSRRILFLLDLNGSGEDADVLLDVFGTLASLFLEGGIPFQVMFRSPEAGGLHLLEADAKEELRPMLKTILSFGGKTPLFPLSPELLPPAAGHLFYLCALPGSDFAPLLRAAYPHAQISVFSPVKGKETPANLMDSRFFPIHPGKISHDLNGFSL